MTNQMHRDSVTTWGRLFSLFMVLAGNIPINLELSLWYIDGLLHFQAADVVNSQSRGTNRIISRDKMKNIVSQMTDITAVFCFVGVWVYHYLTCIFGGKIWLLRLVQSVIYECSKIGVWLQMWHQRTVINGLKASIIRYFHIKNTINAFTGYLKVVSRLGI